MSGRTRRKLRNVNTLYLLVEEGGAADTPFKLSAVVLQSGSMAGGNYTAAVRSGGRWLSCDDSRVTELRGGVFEDDMSSQCGSFKMVVAVNENQKDKPEMVAAPAQTVQPCPTPKRLTVSCALRRCEQRPPPAAAAATASTARWLRREESAKVECGGYRSREECGGMWLRRRGEGVQKKGFFFFFTHFPGLRNGNAFFARAPT
jgi:hypothetical protein